MGIIPTSTKIGYPSCNRKRRMNVTTTTADDAVQKNTVLIALSLRNDKREVLFKEFRAVFSMSSPLFFEEKNVFVPCFWSGSEGHVTFICDNLLGLMA